MNALEHQLDYPFKDTLPDPGHAFEVTPGVFWLRMPLPFALDHINLWLLRDEIEVAREALRAMLKTGAPAPEGRFSDLAMLAPVKDYPPRHASTMLAFEATAEACRRALAKAASRNSGRTSRAGVA